jgi:hypothetical protein
LLNQSPLEQLRADRLEDLVADQGLDLLHVITLLAARSSDGVAAESSSSSRPEPPHASPTSGAPNSYTKSPAPLWTAPTAPLFATRVKRYAWLDRVQAIAKGALVGRTG